MKEKFLLVLAGIILASTMIWLTIYAKNECESHGGEYWGRFGCHWRKS